MRQQELSDCGVACLASIVKFYGGESSLEQLREFSGTTKQGTTLIGLCQAAGKMGFDTDGFKCGIEDLKTISEPVILHVTLFDRLLHYVICYGFDEGKFIIGDPAQGLKKVKEKELLAIWKTKSLLILKPNADLGLKKERLKKKKLWIIGIVKEDINILIAALFLGAILTVLGLSTAIFSQKLIDDILPGKDWDKLLLGIILLSILVIGNSLLTYFRGYLLMRQNRDFNLRIINKFYRLLLFIPKSFFDSRKTGEIISRMNDTTRIQSIISFLIGSLVISILVLIISTGYTFIYSFKVGLIYSFSIPLYVGLAWMYNKKIIGSHREVMVAAAHNESNFIDTINGIETIKSFNRQHSFEALTQAIFRNLQDKAFSLGKLNLSYGLVSGTTGAVFSLSIIVILAVNVMNDQMTMGEMVALLTISSNIIPTVSSLTSTNMQLQEAKVAFERMFEFADIKPEFDEKVTIEKAFGEFRSLQVKGLNFRFPGRKELLKKINFEVKKGEMIALLGENGCGKSTLLQILQKFYEVKSPHIMVNDEKWAEINIRVWRDVLSYVPQNIKIFNTDLVNNISLSGEIIEFEKVIKWCSEWGFSSFFEKFPQGFLTVLGEEGVNISGGQKQLVALARALYRQPQLLLLDEATSAMDRATENYILDLLEELKASMAIILVTHRIKTAKKADRIYTIENGSISHSGNHQQLLMTDNFYSISYQELIEQK